MSYTKTRCREEIEKYEKKIDDVETKIHEKATEDITEYDFETDLGRRRIRRIPLKELQQLKKDYELKLKYWRRELDKLEGVAVRPKIRTVVPRFY